MWVPLQKAKFALTLGFMFCCSHAYVVTSWHECTAVLALGNREEKRQKKCTQQLTGCVKIGTHDGFPYFKPRRKCHTHTHTRTHARTRTRTRTHTHTHTQTHRHSEKSLKPPPFSAFWSLVPAIATLRQGYNPLPRRVATPCLPPVALLNRSATWTAKVRGNPRVCNKN